MEQDFRCIGVTGANSIGRGLYFRRAGIWSPQVKKIALHAANKTRLVVERVLGKDEVTGSIPVPGSRGRLIGQAGRG